MSSKKTKKSKTTGYTKICKGVQKLPSGSYRVRKTIDGVNFSYVVKNLKTAKIYAKDLYGS